MHIFKVDVKAQLPIHSLLKHYKTKSIVNKMIRSANMLLLGEDYGYLQLVDLTNNNITSTHSFEENVEQIRDIIILTDF